MYRKNHIHKTVKQRVFTAQVAPTILQLLGLPTTTLTGAVAEGTQPLPYLETFMQCNINCD